MNYEAPSYQKPTETTNLGHFTLRKSRFALHLSKIARLRQIGNSSPRKIHTLSTDSVLRCKLTAAWSETTCTWNETTATRKGISRDLPFAGTVMCSAFLAGSSFLAPSVSSVSSDSWLEVPEDMGLLAEPNRLANQPVLFGEVTEAPSVSICMVADCTSVQLAEGRDRKTRVKQETKLCGLESRQSNFHRL